MSYPLQETLSYKEVKVPSAAPGWDLDAWRYEPTGKNGPYTVIVMGHGLSCNKSMGLKQYAEIFVKMGYAVVAFDYRRWGASDGMPRHVMRVEDQLEDYRTVIKYCRRQTEFDPNRIVVWGTSFAGGHAVSIASEPQLNVFAAIGQCPYLGVMPPMDTSFTTLKMVGYAILDALKLTLGLSPILIDATAEPGHVGMMNAPDSKPGMGAIAVNVPGAKHPNTINASAILQLPRYSPKDRAKTIACPTLVIHCETDTLCPNSGADAVAAASPYVEVVRVNGGHFDIYPGATLYEEDVQIQTEWLRKHVPV